MIQQKMKFTLITSYPKYSLSACLNLLSKLQKWSYEANVANRKISIHWNNSKLLLALSDCSLIKVVPIHAVETPDLALPAKPNALILPLKITFMSTKQEMKEN